MIETKSLRHYSHPELRGKRLQRSCALLGGRAILAIRYAVPTMAEVAARAGVATSTVSHVLNGTKGVGPATRARVEAAIAEISYQPNQVARALATANTRTIGLAISILSNTYFGEFAHALDTAARAAGYSLILGDTHENEEVELEVISQLLARRVDGVILAPTTQYERAGLSRLLSQNVPIVLVDRCFDAPCDQVGPENVEATASLTAHLAEHGHRRVGMLAGMPELSTSEERVAGYQQAVRQLGLDDDESLLRRGGSLAAPARQAVIELFTTTDPPPTALISANNAMTIGAIRGLRELGLKIPDDVALVCYDDFHWADLFTPSLTAMRQQIGQMGTRSIELLLRQMAGTQHPPTIERIPPTFQRRESCGCATPSG